MKLSTMKSRILFFFMIAANALGNHNNMLDLEGVLPPAANNITLTALPIDIDRLPAFFDALYAQNNAGLEGDLHFATHLFDIPEGDALLPFYEQYFRQLFESARNRFTLFSPCVRAYETLSMGFIYAGARRI